MVLGGGKLPNLTDLRNARFRWEMRAVNLRLPPGQRLAQHFQSVDDGPGGTGKTFNYIHHLRIDDALGFGGYGPGWPHNRDTPLTSNWVEVTIDLVPSMFWWQNLGTSDLRRDLYGAGPIGRVLNRPSGFLSTILIVVAEQLPLPYLNPVDRPSGYIDIRRFSIDIPNV